MNNPKISVLIPTYNYGRYLAQLLESILTQTFKDFEVLVIDDCSSDETDNVMRRLAASDSRIRYKRNPSNIGMVPNWNLSLKEARGEYIKFLFGDDFLVSPQALELLAGALDANPAVSLVGSARRIVDEQSRTKDLWEFYGEDTVREGAEVISTCLLQQRNYIGEPTAVMFRRSQAARGFDDRYRQLVDLEMWFHLLEQGSFSYINKPLCAFRIHDKQQTAKNAAVQATVDDTLLLFRDYLAKPYIAAGCLTRSYLRYDHAYQVWKSYRKRRTMTREQALAKISSYGTTQFFFLYPMYKIYKPIRKFIRFFTEGKNAGKPV